MREKNEKDLRLLNWKKLEWPEKIFEKKHLQSFFTALVPGLRKLAQLRFLMWTLKKEKYGYLEKEVSTGNHTLQQSAPCIFPNISIAEMINPNIFSYRKESHTIL